MTLCLRAQVALLLGLSLATAANAAEELAMDDHIVVVQDTASDAGEDPTASIVNELSGDIQLTQFTSGLSGGGVSPAALGIGSSGCNGQFFVGGEWLYVRADFSQSIAFLENTLPASAVSSADAIITYHQFDYDYNSSFRVYGGYRVCDCGCEVRFTYSSFDSDAAFASPAQPAADTTFTAPFEVITAGAGDSVSGTASVSIDDYDIGFSRTIPLGSPLCCDSGCGDCCECGDGCCDGCGCGCWCPAWDITWTGAIRIADVDTEQNYANNIVSTTNPAVVGRTARSTMSFQGVGLRTGLLGRRYFGKAGIASLYVKGDISLLLGEADYEASGTSFATHRISCTHVIPVTEIEAGGTVFLTKNASITGGYMLAAWHDLGNRAEYDFGASGVQLESWDDANILGLDGFFVRGEVAF